MEGEKAAEFLAARDRGDSTVESFVNIVDEGYGSLTFRCKNCDSMLEYDRTGENQYEFVGAGCGM